MDILKELEMRLRKYHQKVFSKCINREISPLGLYIKIDTHMGFLMIDKNKDTTLNFSSSSRSFSKFDLDYLLEAVSKVYKEEK